MALRRSAEIVGICLVTSACWMLLPLCVTERSTGDPQMFSRGNSCFKEKWFPQILTGARIEGNVGLNLQYMPEPCLYGIQYNPPLCEEAWNAADKPDAHLAKDYVFQCTHGIVNGMKHLPNPRSYCCNFTSLPRLQAGHFQVPSNASCALDLGESFPSLQRHEGSPDLVVDLKRIWSWSRRSKEPEAMPKRRMALDGTVKDNHYNPMAA